MGEIVRIELPGGTVDRDTTIEEYTTILANADIFTRGTDSDADKLFFNNDSGFYLKFEQYSNTQMIINVYNQHDVKCNHTTNGMSEVRLEYAAQKYFTYYKTVQGSIIFGWDTYQSCPQGRFCDILLAPENAEQNWHLINRANASNINMLIDCLPDDTALDYNHAFNLQRMDGGIPCSNVVIAPCISQRKDIVLNNLYKIHVGGQAFNGGIRQAIINNKQYIGFSFESLSANNISTTMFFALDDPNEPVYIDENP